MKLPLSLRYLLIALGAALLFFPFLGRVHLFDWDEINFAEAAREMLVSGDYLRVQIDYQPFWEKPPLFIWLQAASMHLFGVHEYAARFPNALVGVVTLLCLYYVGRKVVHERMARWWVLLYAASWLPHFYFKSGIIDPVFNLFIFLAFFQVHVLRFASRPWLHALLAGMFLGLAVLTKGPVAILVAVLGLGVYVIMNRGLGGLKPAILGLIASSTLLTTLLWFGPEIISNGLWFTREFITYQIRLFRTEDADHGGPFFYHWIVLLIGCFPASVFLFQYKLRGSMGQKEQVRDFTRWMWIMFWVVLLLFSIVKTKIVHYSSLCYFPLSFLAAWQLYRLGNGELQLKKSVRILFLVIGGLLAICIACLPLVGVFKDQIIPLIDDPFAAGNLQAAVPWHWTECLWGLGYLAAVIAAYVLMRRRFRQALMLICVLSIVMIEVTVLHFTPKVEAISQRAAIEYFKQFQGQDVYVHVLGYKSYAHLFYTQKQKPENPAYYHRHTMTLQDGSTYDVTTVDEHWLLNGDIDKPAYFICKVQSADRFRALPQLEELGRKNGFVFFKRKP
jgi:4-amino-4-deoxy-L-arabinose transferase-like glycosyltransferase